MVYQIIFKKRFKNKLEKLLIHLEGEFGILIAQRFAGQLNHKFLILQQQPSIGKQSISFSNIRSIKAGKHNRLYYRVEGSTIVVLNMYDTRINPAKNRMQ